MFNYIKYQSFINVKEYLSEQLFFELSPINLKKDSSLMMNALFGSSSLLECWDWLSFYANSKCKSERLSIMLRWSSKTNSDISLTGDFNRLINFFVLSLKRFPSSIKAEHLMFDIDLNDWKSLLKGLVRSLLNSSFSSAIYLLLISNIGPN